jgi:hypothetical protein
MDEDAMSGALAAVSGAACGSFASEFGAPVCKVTILRGANQIHAGLPTFSESYPYRRFIHGHIDGGGYQVTTARLVISVLTPAVTSVMGQQCRPRRCLSRHIPPLFRSSRLLRSGGALIALSAFLVILALVFAGSNETIFRVFPQSVLAEILFLTGAQLALI